MTDPPHHLMWTSPYPALDCLPLCPYTFCISSAPRWTVPCRYLPRLGLTDTLCQLAFLQWMASSPSLISAPILSLLSSSPPLPHVDSDLTFIGFQHLATTGCPSAGTPFSLCSGYHTSIPSLGGRGETPSSSQSGHLPPDTLLSGPGLWHLHLPDLLPRCLLHTSQPPQFHTLTMDIHLAWAPCIGFWIDLCRKAKEENGS